MIMVVFTRNREIWAINENLGTVRAELYSMVLTAQNTQILTSSYSLLPGITVEWAPWDGYFPVGIAGVTGGPCAPPVYFYATDGSDLTTAQLDFIVQQLSMLPATKSRVQPRQLDPSVACGQADPVGIVNTAYRFPNIQE